MRYQHVEGARSEHVFGIAFDALRGSDMTALADVRAPVRRKVSLALALLVGLAGCAGGPSLGESRPSVTPTMPSPTQGAMLSETTTIEPGTYRVPASAWSVADFSVTFPEGWAVQYGHVYLKHSDAPDELSFYAVVVDDIYIDACEHGEKTKRIGPSVDELADALLEQPGPKVHGPVDTTLGGYPATRVDLTIPKRLDLDTCRLGGIGLQIWYSPPADKYFVLLPNGTASAYIIDIDGQRQVFLTQYLSGASDADVRELRTILDSVHIEP